MKLLLFILFFLFTSCGGQDSYSDCSNTKSPILKRCTPQSDDEKAVAFLNAKEFEKAVTILSKLIGEHPDDYFRYPRLASAYAALAGFDILKVASSQGGGGGGGLDAIGEFLPVPTSLDDLDNYYVYVSYMVEAKEVLALMPENERTANANIFFSSSAQFQYLLYHSSYTLMCMNLINLVVGDGSDVNFDTINKYDKCDATKVISSLLSAAIAAQTNDPVLAGQIGTLKDKIDASVGDGDTEKLVNYLATKKRAADAAQPQ